MIHKRHITILTVVLITDIPLIRKRIWISAQSLTTIFIHPTESRRATSGSIGVKRITILCLDSSTFRVRGNNGTILGTGLVVITSDIPLIVGVLSNAVPSSEAFLHESSSTLGSLFLQQSNAVPYQPNESPP